MNESNRNEDKKETSEMNIRNFKAFMRLSLEDQNILLKHASAVNYLACNTSTLVEALKEVDICRKAHLIEYENCGDFEVSLEKYIKEIANAESAVS